MHESSSKASGCTRFSIDFRTVPLDDVQAERGAANVDNRCTGTAMSDHLRCTDLQHLPEELSRRYDWAERR